MMGKGTGVRILLGGLVTVAVLALSSCGGAAGASGAGAGSGSSEAPQADYWIYVGAESADQIHRLRFGPEGIEVEQTRHIGRLPTEVEGPHGLAVSPDERFLYMSTGHGAPDGHFWKFAVGPDTLVADPIPLGDFPATIDLTPDGLYAMVVNFNLYGSMVPSTMSVVYTPDVVEVDRIELCTMPHGVRTHPTGNWVYTTCMMDDQLVEVDTRSFRVSRRFSVEAGEEGPIETAAVAGHDHAMMDHADHAGMGHIGHAEQTCSPTWALPSADGTHLYVACNRTDEILEVSHESWELTRRFASGRGPYNLATTTDGRLLVATLKQGHAVEFFDLETGTSLATTPTSTNVVHGVVLSPDDRYAFVSVEGIGAEPGKVDVYDLATFERVASAEVGQQASGIDFLRMAPRAP